MVTLLQTHALTIGYGSHAKTSCPIAGPLDLEIRSGQLICLLGPNGAGKSTLLRTLAGLQPALSGTISVGDEAVSLSASVLAKKISLVLTEPVRSHHLTVRSVVGLGRYPYTGWMGVLGANDKAIIEWAMQVTGIHAYADRKMATLSDGEGQKVMLARALAQDTPLMMLDEPTAHLDLPSRIQLMQQLHHLAGTTRKGILVSTHELDLALQVADECWLMQSKGKFDRGAPEDLVLDGVFESAFDKQGIHFDKATGVFSINPGQLREIRLSGEGIAAFWTGRALRRRGFAITDDGTATTPLVTVSTQNERARWTLAYNGNSQEFSSLAALLDGLKKI